MSSLTFNKAYEECGEYFPDGTPNKEGKRQRGMMKVVILAAMYGMQPYTIAESLSIDVKKAKQLYTTFFKTFGGVRQYIDATWEFARQNGYVETLLGQRRNIPDALLADYEFSYVGGGLDPFTGKYEREPDYEVSGRYTRLLRRCWHKRDKDELIAQALQEGIIITDNGWKLNRAKNQAINATIQGTAAQMSKLAKIAVSEDKQLADWGYELICMVHDELIGEAPAENAFKCKDRVSEIMKAVLPLDIPIAVDGIVADRWYGEELKGE
jgi:DNA polymerase I-like protein with 3'-5' exonuclease and polymerase domains